MQALAGDLLEESEWQQVSSSLQDSSKYSSWSKQCFCLYDPSSDFQFLESPFQALGNRSKCPNYNWCHCYPHVPQFFSPSICSSFNCLLLSLCGMENPSIIFLLINTRSGLLAEIRWSIGILKSQRIYGSHSIE